MKHRRIAREIAQQSQNNAVIEKTECGKIAQAPVKLHLSRKGKEGGNTDNNKPFVTIVSGLPRTGTSMMMQMLLAGGMTILTDKKRVSDEDNPKGYFELQNATRLHQQSDWLQDAKGGAVKIVAQLLPYLPNKYEYRIVFMQRDLNEVLGSQNLMLNRLQKKTTAISEQRLRKVFSLQLKQTHDWLEQRQNIQTLFVNYNDVVENPDSTAEQVADFLGGALTVSAMSDIVDPTLYRQRRTK